MNSTAPKETPWRRVFRLLGVNQAELGRLIGKHRSKVCRALNDPKGLISGPDQEALMRAAKERGIQLEPSDLVASNG